MGKHEYKMIINRRMEMLPVWAENKQEAKRKADRIIKEYNQTKGNVYDYMLVEKRDGKDVFFECCLDDVELKQKIEQGIKDYFKNFYSQGIFAARDLEIDDDRRYMRRQKRIEIMMYFLTVILGLGIVMFFVYLRVLLGG